MGRAFEPLSTPPPRTPLKPAWESGLRGRLYAFGRRATPIAWRRALRRRLTRETPGFRKPAIESRSSLSTRARRGRPPDIDRPARDSPGPIGGNVPQQLPKPWRGADGASSTARSAGPASPRSPSASLRESRCCPSAASAARIWRPDPARTSAGGRRRRSGRTPDALRSAGRRPARSSLRSGSRSPPRCANDFGWRVVYDCLDAHEGFLDQPSANPDRGRARAGRLGGPGVATSEALRQRMAEWGASSRLLPNACDFDLFGSLPPPAPDPAA